MGRLAPHTAARGGRRERGDYSIPLAGVHRRSGEQVSETSAFDVLNREKAAIRFLGSASRDCSLFVRDGSSSSPLACCAPSSTPATASSSCRATGLSATSHPRATIPAPALRRHQSLLHLSPLHLPSLTATRRLTDKKAGDEWTTG
ncbi:hypothetical protein [Oryza sativa Japonica Group]|uniref:Uncharacterized protein n=1 Tax=Oryza sativa subsp. japonica TaxID=39947 RepID=Q5JK72_ORYSJ|nr:hypothetical protein [Oryza sativa Japonica Group]